MSSPSSPGPYNGAPPWMISAGFLSLGLAVLGFIASASVGGGSFEGAILAGLLNPLFFVGGPLGVYWLRQHGYFGGTRVAESFESQAPRSTISPRPIRPPSSEANPVQASPSQEWDTDDEISIAIEPEYSRAAPHARETKQADRPPTRPPEWEPRWAALAILLVLCLLAGFIALIAFIGTRPPTPRFQPKQSESAQQDAAALNALLTEEVQQQIADKLKSVAVEPVPKDADPFLILEEALPVTHPFDFRASDVANVRGSGDIIGIVEEGVLVRIEGVNCKFICLGKSSTELRARFSSLPVPDVPWHGVYMIGVAKDERLGSKQQAFIPIISIRSMLYGEEVKHLVDSRAVEIGLPLLSRTLVDNSGRYSVDAVVVESDATTASYIRTDNHARGSVPLQSLATADRRWVTLNRSAISLYGPLVSERLQATAPAAAGAITAEPESP